MHYSVTIFIFFIALQTSCNKGTTEKALDPTTPIPELTLPSPDLNNLSKAYFASGCFWCVEAVYESVKGVHEVISGYAEGKAENATYEKVSSGRTAHVEAIEVYYDSSVVSYKTLVDVFFGSGDPTTLNRQGPDAGYQYRSAIYFQNDNEKQVALNAVKKLEEEKVFANPIVTDITAHTTFFPAEDYHQDFEKRNPNQGYVRAVSVPRLMRFQKAFPHLLKDSH